MGEVVPKKTASLAYRATMSAVLLRLKASTQRAVVASISDAGSARAVLLAAPTNSASSAADIPLFAYAVA